MPSKKNDDFWCNTDDAGHSFGRIAHLMNAAVQREQAAQAKALMEAAAAEEAERKRLEAEKNKPQQSLCGRCGRMSLNPCEPRR